MREIRRRMRVLPAIEFINTAHCRYVRFLDDGKLLSLWGFRVKNRKNRR